MFMLSLMQQSELYGLEQDSLELISAQLLQMLKVKSHDLYSHALQVANYSVGIAAKIGLPIEQVEQIKHAAFLHNIGLIALPSNILLKYPYLNKQEMAKYKQHPIYGASMIENYPCCEQIIPYIKYHHERWDGSGFPKHLQGANIPLGARIIGVADYYVTAINPSSWYVGKTKRAAKQELFSGSGIYFDPLVVKAFLEILG